MKYKVIMFDFDGTLANSDRVVHEILERLIKKYNYPNVTAKALKHKEAGNAFQKIKMLLFMAKIKKEFKWLYGENITRVHWYEGAENMLADIARLGYGVVILSSNDKGNILSFLHNSQMDICPEIVTAGGLFGKHRTIRRYMRDNGFTATDVLYVGDEIRDIKACNKVGADIAFANWGVDANEDLSGYTVKRVLEKPSDLMAFCVAADPFYSEENMNRLRKAIADMDAGRNMAEHELIEVDDEK